MLAALKAEIKNRAYYWPTTDRLAFKFAEGIDPEGVEEPEIDPELLEEAGRRRPRRRKEKKIGFSSGERQLKSLQEITRFTDASVYLFDEWDANLDTNNRALADELVRQARAARPRHRNFTPRPRLSLRQTLQCCVARACAARALSGCCGAA